MSARRIGAIALAGALLAGGSGAAIAAITKDDHKKAEQSILDSAAKRLSVTPEALRDALSAAQDEGLDQAVKDGLLTQTQADAIKADRKRSGRVLGGPFGGPGRHRFGPGGPDVHRFGPGGPGVHEFGPGGPGLRHRMDRPMLFDDLAKALDLTTAKLLERLRDGTSVAEMAKAQGKSLEDVRAAVKAAARTRADKAVKDGDITQAQADKKLSHLDDVLQRLEIAKPLFGRHGPGDRPPRLHGGGGPNGPGSFVPVPVPGGDPG